MQGLGSFAIVFCMFLSKSAPPVKLTYSDTGGVEYARVGMAGNGVQWAVCRREGAKAGFGCLFRLDMHLLAFH